MWTSDQLSAAREWPSLLGAVGEASAGVCGPWGQGQGDVGAQGWGGMLGGQGLGLIRGSEQGHNIGTRAWGNVNGQTEMDGCGRE